MFVNTDKKLQAVNIIVQIIVPGVCIMDEDQLFELEYHDEMEILEELENGKIIKINFEVATIQRTDSF